MTGWLRRGERASEGSRYREFHDQVLQAESDPHRPRLLPLVETPPHEVNAAWKFLEANEWAMPEPQPPEPVLVRVLHHDGTPIGGTHD